MISQLVNTLQGSTVALELAAAEMADAAAKLVYIERVIHDSTMQSIDAGQEVGSHARSVRWHQQV